MGRKCDICALAYHFRLLYVHPQEGSMNPIAGDAQVCEKRMGGALRRVCPNTAAAASRQHRGSGSASRHGGSVPSAQSLTHVRWQVVQGRHAAQDAAQDAAQSTTRGAFATRGRIATNAVWCVLNPDDACGAACAHSLSVLTLSGKGM